MSVPSIAFYPPLSPAALLRGPAEQMPYPLAEDDCMLFSRGRHALWHAAHALDLASGRSVLAPAWHHGAEIEALRRAGTTFAFYDLTAQLEPDADELESLLRPDTRALFLTHYLGFPQDCERWRAWCDERGLLLIEDAAHACLARSGTKPVGSFGDAAVWCLFKSFAVADGAALRLAGETATPAGKPVFGSSAAARRQALWVLQRSPALARALGHGSNGNGHYDHQAEIALGDPQPLSSASEWLLPRVADEDAAARRRAHYAILLEELRDLVTPPFDQLPDGAVPLGLPLRSDDKPSLLGRLADHGIDAVDFWSRSHPVAERTPFPRSDMLRSSTVLVPVHQELRPSDLARIAAAARPRRHAAPDVLHVELASSIAALADEWTALARTSGSVFQTPEWADAWCRHFLSGRPLRLIAFRTRAGRLVGVLPAYERWSRPLRVLRLIGHGPGEELGPVCAPADRARVARALGNALTHVDAEVLLAEHVTRDAGWSALTGAQVLRTERSPAIQVANPDWASFVASRSKRLRKELRRSERELASNPRLRIREVSCADADLESALDDLFALHGARWAETGSPFLDHAAFHRDVARIAAARGWLRLVFLEDDGRPVAASYGFRYEGAELDYQGGRDPEWTTGASPGLALLAWMVRAAFEAGICNYRLLRGGEWYKTRFATHDRGVETFAVGHGALGTAAAAAAAHLPSSVSGPLRQRLRA